MDLPTNALEHARDRLRRIRPQFGWPPPEDADLATWAATLRDRLADAVGGLYEPLPEPDVQTLKTEQVDGFTRTTVLFPSRPDLNVYGYLMVPDGLAKPAPAIVAIPGHGIGLDAVAGLKDDGYSNAYGLQAVRHGFVTLAIEQISFGYRTSEPCEPGDSTCHRDSMAALMLGETMTGWRVRDAMAAVSVLAALPQVDPTKIATLGISGGGLTSFFTGCLDERVAATVVSGYFNTFFDSIGSIHHCADNYVPGLPKLAEMPDLVACIAPRGLFVESGVQDHIFPIGAFRGACQKAEAIYEAWGRPNMFGCEEFHGGHIFHGAKVFDWLKRWLGAEGSDSVP